MFCFLWRRFCPSALDSSRQVRADFTHLAVTTEPVLYSFSSLLSALETFSQNMPAVLKNAHFHRGPNPVYQDNILPCRSLHCKPVLPHAKTVTMEFSQTRFVKAVEWNLFAVASLQISKDDYIGTNTAWLCSICEKNLKINSGWKCGVLGLV